MEATSSERVINPELFGFKRLKSLLGIGYLPKQDLTGACVWLHGKLLAAFLVEALICAGERFSPGGTRFAKTSGRSRCLWRETSLMFHLLSQAVNPRLGLAECIISKMLIEAPRKRLMQNEKLKAIFTNFGNY